jgi:Lysyl oxidase
LTSPPTARPNAEAARRPWARVFVAGCVTLASAAAIVAVDAGTSSAGRAASPLRPDLTTRPFAEIELCREHSDVIQRDDACTTEGQGRIRTVLRITSQVANTGRGPLEFAPTAPSDGDCNHNGNPDDDLRVDQVLYVDGNGNNIFDRGTDTQQVRRPAGCRYYHPAHDHYHLEGYASFELRSERTGRLARKGKKVSFCISDSRRFNTGLPGAPTVPFYDIAACDREDSVSGTSVGWYDEYTWKLSGQEINVTGLRPGRYCLISKADPGGAILERLERNNVRRARIRLNPRAAPPPGADPRRISPLRGRCRLGR